MSPTSTIVFENLIPLPEDVSINTLVEYMNTGNIIISRYMKNNNIIDLCFKHSDNNYPSMACNTSGDAFNCTSHDLSGIKETLRFWKDMFKFRFFVLTGDCQPISNIIRGWVDQSNNESHCDSHKIPLCDLSCKPSCETCNEVTANC